MNKSKNYTCTLVQVPNFSSRQREKWLNTTFFEKKTFFLFKQIAVIPCLIRTRSMAGSSKVSRMSKTKTEENYNKLSTLTLQQKKTTKIHVKKVRISKFKIIFDLICALFYEERSIAGVRSITTLI